MTGESDIRALLIGGFGRSGTNILKDLLASHTHVAALPFETRFPVDPDGLCMSYRELQRPCSPFSSEIAVRRLDSFLKRVERRTLADKVCVASERVGVGKVTRRFENPYKEWELEKYFPGFRQYRRDLIQNLMAAEYIGYWPGANNTPGNRRRVIAKDDKDDTVTDAFRKFVNNTYGAALTSQNASIYVDDNTFNVLFVGELVSLMPGARFVHVVRDPRDIVTSYVRQRWTPRRLKQAIMYYKYVVSCWLRCGERTHQDRVETVKLENLCEHPTGVVSRVLGMLGESGPVDVSRIDPARANIGCWRRELDKESQKLVNRELEPYVRYFGYEAD